MYLTTQEVLNLRNEVQAELDDFDYGRANKHIYKIQGPDRIMLLYVVDLLNKLLKMLKRGQYKRVRLMDAFRQQDWVWYSCHKKAIYSEVPLKERLGYKPSRKIKYYKLIAEQAYYLEWASNYIVDRLG